MVSEIPGAYRDEINPYRNLMCAVYTYRFIRKSKEKHTRDDLKPFSSVILSFFSLLLR